jgi:hypothetical protein
LACPICEKRKAKRLCPARAESICTVCCGTEREVTIDCPRDCPYLLASREYEVTRQPLDRSKLPFADVQIPLTLLQKHGQVLEELNYAICDFAAERREVVDVDVLAALQSLAEAYRTLTSGIYYENPPVHPLQRGIYEELKRAIADFKKEEAQRKGMAATRDGDIRDVLIFLTQLGATRTNGRPKGRAYLDFLRRILPEEEFQKSSSNLVLPY